MALAHDAIENIASNMLKAPSPVRNGTSSVDVVLTYVGQLVSHDIVPPTTNPTPLREVTPALNLDSIYGSSPLYYFKHFPERTGFLSKPGRFFTGRAGDLKRNAGVAIIPEPRNDENQIVSQFHRFWQDVHNKLVAEENLDALQARATVTRLFQLVVIEDLLAQVLDERVFHAIFRNGQSFLDAATWEKSIPAFFRFASFRFGHSIIRPRYQLSPDAPFQSIEALFRKDSNLVRQNKIDWPFFARARRMHSTPFDTFIPSAMGQIPQDTMTANITTLNLAASTKVAPTSGDALIDWLLAQKSGQLIRDQLGLVKLQSVEGASFAQIKGVTIHNLPLWPYLLLEAQVFAYGNRLGVLGSLLNAEVLAFSIQSADISVYINNVYDPVAAKYQLGNVGQKIFGNGNVISTRAKTAIQRIAEYQSA